MSNFCRFYVLYITVASFAITLSCLQGEYISNITGLCTQCRENCKYCNSTDVCFACKTGYKCVVCEHACSNCLHGTACTQHDGYCIQNCSEGLSGNNCSEKCDFNCKSCDRFINKICFSCAHNRFGNNCKEKCSVACMNNTCNDTEGECTSGCSAGYWGTHCTNNCSHCEEKVCGKDGECLKIDQTTPSDIGARASSCSESWKKRMSSLSYGKRMLKAVLEKGRASKTLDNGTSPIEEARFYCEAGYDRDGFMVKYISDYKGFGVITKTSFKKGDFLLEYVGERISAEEAVEREWRGRKQMLRIRCSFTHSEEEDCGTNQASNGKKDSLEPTFIGLFIALPIIAIIIFVIICLRIKRNTCRRGTRDSGLDDVLKSTKLGSAVRGQDCCEQSTGPSVPLVTLSPTITRKDDTIQPTIQSQKNNDAKCTILENAYEQIEINLDEADSTEASCCV